ncbi:ROK family protein [Streptomyces anulatus]|uniref:ROK family protein n=1 Tax=Streptomyces anulatus TaxID=1892 RepID=UPI0036D8369D
MTARPFSVSRARASDRPVAVLDLGGTWFRAGVLTGDDTVEGLRRQPAVTTRSTRGPAAGVQRRMTDWIVDTLDELRAAWPAPIGLCAVSLGAAMDDRTGRVIGGAPLFGAEATDWRPAGELAARRPEVTWAVLNDVSALAYALLKDDALDPSRTAAALTVSTGIAYRTIDLATGRIPRDRRYGLQGEVGHLPSRMEWDGAPVAADCDCGAPGHVSAFASGRGIEGVLRRVPARDWGGGPDAAGSAGALAAFGRAVTAGHDGARRLLDAVTTPLAEVLLAQACLNPQVEYTVLTGGVVDGLGDPYLDSLRGNLGRLGLYGISDRDPDYFAPRILRGRSDGLCALRGAGIHARGLVDGSESTP